MMKRVSGIYRALLWIDVFFSAVFCALCPPVLLALGGNWLCTKFGWNKIVVALLVLFGVAVGMKSMLSAVKKSSALLKQTDPADKG